MLLPNLLWCFCNFPAKPNHHMKEHHHLPINKQCVVKTDFSGLLKNFSKITLENLINRQLSHLQYTLKSSLICLQIYFLWCQTINYIFNCQYKRLVVLWLCTNQKVVYSILAHSSPLVREIVLFCDPSRATGSSLLSSGILESPVAIR